MTLEGIGSIVTTADNTANYIDSIATYKVSRNAKGPEMSKMVHARGPFVTLHEFNSLRYFLPEHYNPGKYI